jgi:hypothetical protein
MNYLYMRRFILFIFLSIFILGTCNAQSSHKSSPKNPEKRLFGNRSSNSGKVNGKEPRSVHKAKREQEKNEIRLKKEYAQSVERSRERSYDIQSPEVKARMKQNQKDTALRNKEKKKKVKESSKKAGKKYK